MRPTIHHLDTAALPWEEILDTKAMRKVLSLDPVTGSDTSYVRLPPVWQGPAGAHYHTDFEEALVLSGDVDLNGDGDVLVAGSYLYRPGGIVHGRIDRSTGGADIIIKMGTATDLISVGQPLHRHEYDQPGRRKQDGRPHVVHLKADTQPWEAWNGAHRRVLSRNVETGAETMRIRLDPGASRTLTLLANETWEWVVIAGSFKLADGPDFARLGYSFRPKGACADAVIEAAATGCDLLAWREP